MRCSEKKKKIQKGSSKERIKAMNYGTRTAVTSLNSPLLWLLGALALQEAPHHATLFARGTVRSSHEPGINPKYA